MSDEKKQEIHVHHHYAPAPRRRSRKRKMRRPNKKSRKKVFSVVINIIEELVRLA